MHFGEMGVGVRSKEEKREKKCVEFTRAENKAANVKQNAYKSLQALDSTWQGTYPQSDKKTQGEVNNDDNKICSVQFRHGAVVSAWWSGAPSWRHHVDVNHAAAFSSSFNRPHPQATDPPPSRVCRSSPSGVTWRGRRDN